MRIDDRVPEGDCPRCGYHVKSPIGFPEYTDYNGGKKLMPDDATMQTGCPRCGTEVQLRRPRERIEVDLVDLLRQADLSADQISRLQDALAESTSAKEIGDRVPKARKLVAHAQRISPEGWIALLGVLVTMAGIIITHHDANQARLGDNQPTKPQRTSGLTEQDARQLRQELNVYLEGRRVGQDRDDRGRGEAQQDAEPDR